jgi:TolA-binding protein
VTHFYRIAALAACTSLALAPAPAVAQRQQPSPEQRIDRLEKQISQMQRQVFPRGRPADTAGFSTEPAATQSSVVTLDQRLNSVERQMTDLLRQSEENGHRLQALEADIAKIRADQDQRIGALEQRMADAAAAAPVVAAPADEPPVSRLPSSRPPARGRAPSSTARPTGAALSDALPATADASAPASDPGEDAYSEGFHEWQAGQFDQAIATLKTFVAAYPKHRRASFANNLIGRAYLDKGDPQSAAAVLLANYRSNPDGERAQDSLYYLGQAVMKLGQPGQACKAYAELESVYGAKVRDDLQKPLSDAKARAQCS